MSLRKSQKEATRRRVLEAARELFERDGYEETTVRAIARQAKVSVGSVFTNFATKAEVLSHVMEDRLDVLYAELDRVAPLLRGSTADRLRSLLALHVAFEAPRVRLYAAHIAATYSWKPGSNAVSYGRNARLLKFIRDVLAEGAKNGDIGPEVDLDELVDLVVAAYGWTYRLVSWEGADSEALISVMDRQISLVLRTAGPARAAGA